MQKPSVCVVCQKCGAVQWTTPMIAKFYLEMRGDGVPCEKLVDYKPCRGRCFEPKHFDGPDKSCFDWGCCDDCPVLAAYKEDQDGMGRQLHREAEGWATGQLPPARIINERKD